MSEPFLITRALRKEYHSTRRPVEVLHGVDLRMNRGEFISLRGASGSGKSTLLHLLGGLDVPTSGEVKFNGSNLRNMSGRGLARFRNRKLGFVFQAYHLLPELDALENVLLPARMARLPSRETEERARALLCRVGLKDRTHHLPAELSGGEQQRVALARALVNQPELVLADEPTGNLDSGNGGQILDLLCRMQEEEQLSLIIATHDDSVANSAQKKLKLVDGVIQGP